MLPKITHEDTRTKTLGETKIKSPIHLHQGFQPHREVLYNPFVEEGTIASDISFKASAPSKMIYFDPKKVRAAIVTCGGICPGLNDVIRSIVLRLWHGYGVRKIIGVQFGFQGFIAKYGLDFVDLNPEVVSKIHELGGTMLGSSRGEQPIEDIVDSMERQSINQLYVIGGDGSLRATQAISKEVTDRGLKITVVGIPKTIDNDIAFVSRSFGFETAVDAATEAIRCAHSEATSFPNGIGLVKLMGRHSGFIAATAALAQRDVNIVLIPEVDFDLEGDHGLFKNLEERLKTRGHAVIVVAEGAGQEHVLAETNASDASGNVKLKDIGVFIRDQISEHFKKQNLEVNIKYIDPSYMVRSVPANTNDGLYCATLGQNAVHASMAGKTELLVSMWHGVYCILPIHLAISQRKTIIPDEGLWLNVLESTGQPSFKPLCDL
ncbi:MAG: ATP-dependent 6-phosphofructokinase [SAR324 cluster bacterium]|nr:ATP-dependent 6-phosphofructokinase [SAR324 cluster bacterium]